MTALLFVALAVASAGGQQHWPQFRGPKAGVAADNPELPETWSASDNVAWKVAIPGLGWSSRSCGVTTSFSRRGSTPELLNPSRPARFAVVTW
jgi:hypothetical protein